MCGWNCVCVCERERERERERKKERKKEREREREREIRGDKHTTAKIDTSLRYITREPCFLVLLLRETDTGQLYNQGTPPTNIGLTPKMAWLYWLPTYCSLCWLTTDYLGVENFRWLSQAIHPYRLSFLESSLDDIKCSYSVLAAWSTLVCPCVGVHWRTSLMSSAQPVLQVLFVFLTWFVWWKVSDCTAAVLWGAAFGICLKQHVTSLCSSHQAFSRSALQKSWCCIHTIVLTLLQLGIIQVLFSLSDKISLWSTTCRKQFTASSRVCWHRFQLMRYYHWGIYIFFFFRSRCLLYPL